MGLQSPLEPVQPKWLLVCLSNFFLPPGNGRTEWGPFLPRCCLDTVQLLSNQFLLLVVNLKLTLTS